MRIVASVALVVGAATPVGCGSEGGSSSGQSGSSSSNCEGDCLASADDAQDASLLGYRGF
jgi:hypothetical protein